MTKDNGGPAFPIPLNPGESYQGHHIADGMTLRDYFAAKAMQASRARNSDYKSWSDLAADAYELADAMLKEREK